MFSNNFKGAVEMLADYRTNIIAILPPDKYDESALSQMYLVVNPDNLDSIHNVLNKVRDFLEIVRSKQQLDSKEETETLTDLCFNECITELHATLGDIAGDIRMYLSEGDEVGLVETVDKQKKEWRSLQKQFQKKCKYTDTDPTDDSINCAGCKQKFFQQHFL